MTNENTAKVVRDTLENGKQVMNVSYNGILMESKPEEIYVRLGVGNDWADLKEVKMKFDPETNMYNALIEAGNETDKINFCFKNDVGEWDNNDGENYTFEPAHKEETVAEIQPGEQKLEQSLMVIEESKKSLVAMVNQPIDISHIIELIAKMFDSIKETLTTLFNGKKGHEDELLL